MKILTPNTMAVLFTTGSSGFNMKHDKNQKGSVGLFTDIGTEAFFKDLDIEYWD